MSEKNTYLPEDVKIPGGGFISFDRLLNDEPDTSTAWKRGKYHFHSQLELKYMIAGHGKIILDNDISFFSQRSLVIIKPFQLHEYEYACGKLEFINCYIDIETFCRIFDKSFLGNVISQIYSTIRTLDSVQSLPKHHGSIFEKLYSCGTMNMIMKVSAVLEIFIMLSGLCRSQKKEGNHEQFWDVLHYIDMHYAERIDLKKISASFGITPYYFARKFRNIFSMSLNNYVTKIRINKAKSMLLATSASVHEIGKAAGIQDKSCFARLFKKYYNVSPQQMRKEFIKNNNLS